VAQTHLITWMNTFPQPSIQKLKSINNATNGAYHVILSLSYGLYDERIRRLNGMVIGLLVCRLKAKRANRTDQINKINQILLDFHQAVDQITNVSRDHNSHSVCNSVSRTSTSLSLEQAI
jgi:hypothetical protein